MRIFTPCLFGVMLAIAPMGAGQAASLQVSPVHVEVAAPASGSSLSLQNTGASALNVQLRVFKWSQHNGRSVLRPTRDVVASPPATKLMPRAVHTIRLVRVAQRPVTSEESYRLLVDEIPDRTRAASGKVSFLLRYSIPVFFTASGKARAALSWRAQLRRGKLHLSATNSGRRRSRISSLRITGRRGRTLASRMGLAGYVLGGSTARWTLPLLKRLAPGSRVTITAKGDNGPIAERAVVRAAR